MVLSQQKKGDLSATKGGSHMRTITKTVSYPVNDTPMDFRVTKLDAFSGARLLKLLSSSSAETLNDLLFSLSDVDLHSLMETCLYHAEASLPAGYIRVYDKGCWGVPDLEYETWLCLRLTMDVLSWSLEGFFPDGGQPS